MREECLEMKCLGEHPEERLEGEGARAEEVHSRFDYGPID